jgi:hypothetical protein
MAAANKMFIPSVGPVRECRMAALLVCISYDSQGYDDTKIRPWNVEWRRSRDGGVYYDRMSAFGTVIFTRKSC